MGAPFLAGLQLIIYAGAVMVLFIMVLMLFDFKKSSFSFLKNKAWLQACLLFGLLAGIIALMAFSGSHSGASFNQVLSMDSVAILLFTKYVLIFELIGLFLLALAIGVVAISRLDKDT